MAFAGGVGADVTDLKAVGASLSDDGAAVQRVADAVRGRGEAGERGGACEACFAGLPLAKVGTTVEEPRLRIAGANGEWLVWAKLDELKEAWQKPLRW